MSRIFLVGIFLATLTALISANPQDEQNARIQKKLALQTAMARARILLTEQQSQKAVEVLEDQLDKVNGDNQYLQVLGEAYRACVKDLYIAGQPELAKRYLDRLRIISPAAANDKALQPLLDTTPREFKPEPEPTKETAKLQLPQFKLQPSIPQAKGDDKPPTLKFSRTVEDSIDPFATPNQRLDLVSTPRNDVRANEMLTRGADEFKNERYTQARWCFEQAVQADPAALQACKGQLAYCIIKGVTEAMDQPGVLPGKLPELKLQVEQAISMAPGNVMTVGQDLITRLEQRSKMNVPATKRVRHWGQNKEGWHVSESQHFRIFHRKDNEFGERVAQVAEHTRATMFRKWFNSDGVTWEPICEIIVHATGSDYAHMTGVGINVPGHSHVEVDNPTKRIVLRRVDVRLDIPTMLDTVLPHETTHVVLAGMFGDAPVPRWADEGIAVLTEPEEKVSQHRRNLIRHHKDQLLFGLKELMEMKNYPQPRQVGAFYAQSVVLVEFLVSKRGPKTLTDFVNDGIRSGYDSALQRHYGMTFAQLEQEWRTQVIERHERMAAAK